MGEKYFNLKRKLEELNYNNSLPPDAVPLVECILSDLLQTTQSLQHYMDLSKEALSQRDSLMMEAEPYKCDNARLIQDNNNLHRELIQVKEENMKLTREYKRKFKKLSEELIQKDTTICKLQHEVRDLSLRGLCAETQSSRNKSKIKCGSKDEFQRNCNCSEAKPSYEQNTVILTKKLQDLQDSNNTLSDEILILKSQVEHRDNEIIRLNILLEGGRPLTKDYCNTNSATRIQELNQKIHELESTNNLLKKQLNSGLEKQHEAMLRALNLADKNKYLQDELKKVDSLALKVEEDCNKRLATLNNEISTLQIQLDNLSARNLQLEKDLSQSKCREQTNIIDKFKQTFDDTLKDREKLQNEIQSLSELNKTLQEALSVANNKHIDSKSQIESDLCKHKCQAKNELQKIIDSERKVYEKYMANIQEKLTETISIFNMHISKCKDASSVDATYKTDFVRDLNVKLCESEQKILMLKKENEDLKAINTFKGDGNMQNYKDIIKQLNNENSELSKENLSLSQQMIYYKGLCSKTSSERDGHSKKDINKLQNDLEKLVVEAQLLRKDKDEYNERYKEAMDLAEKYKRDLAYKHKEIEQLREENASYKTTQRTGKASADHLREEISNLRDQIKKMQSDVIRERTLANQIKNIQIETERSSNEIQNDVICLQKKLSISKDTIETLEKKCRDYQNEISSLKNNQSNIVDNIRRLDQERDKLVIELDHKTEANSVLEQKLKMQSYEISRLENEICDLKRKLNSNKISEHKLVDTETQIKYLNEEISRLTQQFDNAIIENKRLQNSLADANGSLKITKIEYEKSRKEVEELRQQLQHYVAEIRRIEELLSHKEAERSDMLEHFASLSVEANILENTNHSLESESASKSLQLQNYVIKIQDLESKLLDKDGIIESKSTQISDMMCKMTSLENEIKLITEEKLILEQNVAHLKKMCNNLQSDQKILCEADSELKLYENKIKSLSSNKASLEVQNLEIKEKLKSTEKLLSNARKEIIELKLALQDATSETKSLHERLSRMSRHDIEVHERTLTKEVYEIPLTLEETIQGSHEDDEDGHSSHTIHEIHRRYSKYCHGNTL